MIPGGRNLISENRSHEKKIRRRPNRLSKVEGVNLNVGFDQRRSGWCQSGNKPACSEYRYTERFKAQCPIWISKTKRWANTPPPSTKKGREDEKGKGKSVRYTSLEPIGNGFGNDAIPESQVNVATRQVNLSDVLAGSACRNKDRPNGRSSIIDPWLSGGGLRSYA